MTNLIGISGRIGSGKDLTAKIINWLIWKEKFHKNDESIVFSESWYPKKSDVGMFEVKKFAGKLKEICALLTGCSVLDLENPEFKNKPLGEEWNEFVSLKPIGSTYLIMTYRTLLQKIGTEAMRNAVHKNVWVNALFADYHKSITVGKLEGTYPNWVISDMRFPNELRAVKEKSGITIRINRPWIYTEGGLKIVRGQIKELLHPSETSLDDAEFDYTIDNEGSVEKLVEKVKEILIKENIL